MTAPFPKPIANYSASEEAQFRAIVERGLGNARSAQEDVELATGQRLIMRSPDGSRWSIVVSDAGVLSAVAL